MHAVILAAGRGSRMAGLTGDRPKCLLELAGRPLLDWQLAALRRAGLGPVTVVRGYLAPRLAGPGYAVLDNPRWAETNMVATLLAAAPVLEREPAVVAYADILYRAEAVQRLAACPADLALTYDLRWEELWRLRFADPLADAETFRAEAGRLLDIGRRPSDLDEVGGQYMGLWRFTPAGFAAVRKLVAGLEPDRADRLDMTALARLLLEQGREIASVPVAGGWCECDSPGDLDAYALALALADAGGPAWSHDWREETD